MSGYAELLEFDGMCMEQQIEFIMGYDYTTAATNQNDLIRHHRDDITRSKERLKHAKERHMEIVADCEDCEFRIQHCSIGIMDLEQYHASRRAHGQARLQSMRVIDDLKIYIKEKVTMIQDATVTMNRYVMAALKFYEIEGVGGYVFLKNAQAHRCVMSNGYEWDLLQDRYCLIANASTTIDDAS